MRALKVLVVVMGVLIVLGTAGLVAAVVYRARHRAGPPVAAVPEAAGPDAASPVAARAVLDEPVGTRIAAITSVAGRLALSLQGGGPDRVVLLDPATGRIAGRVSLAR